MRVSLAITPLGWTDRILSFGNAGAPWYLGCGRSMSRRTDWEKFTGGRLPYSSSPGMSLAVTECHFAMVECHGGFVRFCNPRAGWDQDCSHWTVPNSASLALMHDKVSVTHPRLIHLPQADAAEVEQSERLPIDLLPHVATLASPRHGPFICAGEPILKDG